jgi:hypothetical protein
VSLHAVCTRPALDRHPAEGYATPLGGRVQCRSAIPCTTPALPRRPDGRHHRGLYGRLWWLPIRAFERPEARRLWRGSAVSGTPTITATVPRLALRREEAAAAIGVSVDHFDAHVRHELRAVRRGRIVVYPVRELERWLEKNAASVLEGER